MRSESERLRRDHVRRGVCISGGLYRSIRAADGSCGANQRSGSNLKKQDKIVEEFGREICKNHGQSDRADFCFGRCKAKSRRTHGANHKRKWRDRANGDRCKEGFRQHEHVQQACFRALSGSCVLSDYSSAAKVLEHGLGRPLCRTTKHARRLRGSRQRFDTRAADSSSRDSCFCEAWNILLTGCHSDCKVLWYAVREKLGFTEISGTRAEMTSRRHWKALGRQQRMANKKHGKLLTRLTSLQTTQRLALAEVVTAATEIAPDFSNLTWQRTSSRYSRLGRSDCSRASCVENRELVH